MSSEEEKCSLPVTQNDSNGGSSVSSDLQEEYEELLRYAIVTPNIESRASQPFHSKGEVVTDVRFPTTIDDILHNQVGNSPAEREARMEVGKGRDLNIVSHPKTEGSSPVSSPRKSSHPVMEFFSSNLLGESSSAGSNPSPAGVQELAVGDLLVSEENLQKVENVLDLWSSGLKTNVISELTKWRLNFIDWHRIEMKKEKEKHAAHLKQLCNQINSLKELQKAYEISIGRKDEPDSTATERTTVRLATHPLLKKKIDVLKAAVKAFKDARQNDTEVQSSKNASEENYSRDTSGASDDAIKLQHEGDIVSEQKDKEAKMLTKKSVNSSKEKIAKMEHGPKTVDIPNSPSKPSEKDSVVPYEPQKIPANRKMKPLCQNKKKEVPKSSLGENSDGEELHEEEKEYFDNSTEERFYSQSSMSEDSDSGDDFFIGKVRRTGKKESNCHSSAVEQNSPQKVSPEDNILETHQGIRNDKNKSSTEGRKFESVSTDTD